MSLRKYLSDKKIKMKDIASSSGIPYSSLAQIANETIDIDRTSTGTTAKLAKALNISMDELYSICHTSRELPSFKHSKVVIKKYKYYLEYVDNNITKYLYLGDVTPDTKYYIEDIAKWSGAKLRYYKEKEDE